MGRPLACHMCTDMCITSLHNRSGLTCASVRFLPFRCALVQFVSRCLTPYRSGLELAPTSAFQKCRHPAIVERAKSYEDELLSSVGTTRSGCDPYVNRFNDHSTTTD